MRIGSPNAHSSIHGWIRQRLALYNGNAETDSLSFIHSGMLLSHSFEFDSQMTDVTPLLQLRKDATAASCNSHLETVEAA
jgi:hypothetical protein